MVLFWNTRCQASTENGEAFSMPTTTDADLAITNLMPHQAHSTTTNHLSVNALHATASLLATASDSHSVSIFALP